jgi:hypothetical protein
MFAVTEVLLDLSVPAAGRRWRILLALGLLTYVPEGASGAGFAD